MYNVILPVSLCLKKRYLIAKKCILVLGGELVYEERVTKPWLSFSTVILYFCAPRIT